MKKYEKKIIEDMITDTEDILWQLQKYVKEDKSIDDKIKKNMLKEIKQTENKISKIIPVK